MGQVNLIDVDAATKHAQNAKDRNRAARRLQAVEHIAEPQTASQVVGLGEILRGGWELTTQTNNGNTAVIRVPHSILAVLVTITLALVAGGFWLVSSITEMKTNLGTIQESQRDIKREQSSNLKLMTAYATNETNRINFLTGLLTESQRRQVYEYDRGHPRPNLPDSDEQPERNQ